MAYISVYDYKDYKEFVKDWIELSPNKGRGQRMKLAEALGCQTPFVTHVLSGEYHFSNEQAESCARWIGLNDEESEFFVLLVLRQKAATKEVAQLFERQLSKRRKEENILKRRLDIKEGLSTEAQLQYYSQWYYAAIHMALLNPVLHNIEALSAFFQLNRNQILSILDFLNETGLIEFTSVPNETTKQIKVKSPMVHLEFSSPLISMHHTNYRLKAIDSIKNNPHTNKQLHYSSVISLSVQDFEWMKSRLMLLLEEVKDRVKDSPDETLIVLNLDCFRLQNDN